MPSEIYLVKVGMTMTEGTVEKWYVKDGERVEIGEPVYSLETEKVNMDVEAESSGIVKHLVPEGATLEPGDVIGWLFADGEDIPNPLPVPKANPNISVVNEEGSVPAPEVKEIERLEVKPGKRSPSSPAARRLADELGVNIDSIQGSGPGGRITKDDVETAAKVLESSPDGVAEEGEPISQMRRVIGKRMFDSLQTTAQLTISMKVVMDDAIKLRESLNEEWKSAGIRLAYTDLIARASIKALEKYPIMQAFFVEESLRHPAHTNVGIAVAVEDGLLVPVIKSAESMSLQSLSRDATQLSQSAREGKLGLDDLSDGTFTISSLGMYGVDVFTPILNPPQTSILGVGRIYDGVNWVGDIPTRIRCSTLSLTWDHRVTDGVPAAQFLGEVKLLLEAPHRLLV